MSLRAGLLMFLALCATAGVARAEHVEAALVYRAASGCPSEARFRELVAVRLGYDPFVAGAAARVEVELAAQQGQITLDSGGRRKVRKLAGSGCEAVAEALATTLVMALDPLAATRPPERPDELDAPLQPAPEAPAQLAEAPLVPASEPSAPPAVASLPPPEARPPPAPAPRVKKSELAGGAFASTSYGMSPDLSPAGSLAVAFSRAHLYVAVDMRLVGRSRVSTAEAEQVQARHLSGGLWPCGRFGSFLLCGVLRVGKLWWDAQDLRERRIERQRTVHLGPALGYLIRVAPRSRLALGFELAVPLTKNRLPLDDDETWQGGTLAAALSIGGLFGLE